MIVAQLTVVQSVPLTCERIHSHSNICPEKWQLNSIDSARILLLKRHNKINLYLSSDIMPRWNWHCAVSPCAHTELDYSCAKKMRLFNRPVRMKLTLLTKTSYFPKPKKNINFKTFIRLTEYRMHKRQNCLCCRTYLRRANLFHILQQIVF